MSAKFDTYPFALSPVEGLQRVFTQSGAQDDKTIFDFGLSSARAVDAEGLTCRCGAMPFVVLETRESLLEYR